MRSYPQLHAMVTAAFALAVALSTLGAGVASAWAGSDQSSQSNFTSSSYEVDLQRVLPSSRTPISPIFPNSHVGLKLAEICSPTHTVCPPGDNEHCCDPDMACRYTHAPAGSFVGWSRNPTCEPPLGPGNACLDDNECVSGVCETIPNHPETSVSPTGRVGRCQ